LAFIAFVLVIIGSAILLLDDRQFTEPWSTHLNVLPLTAFMVFIVLVVGNVISTLLICGRALCPDHLGFLGRTPLDIRWDACGRIGFPFGSLFKMLLVTGQRRGEVSGMRWSEITDDGWHIPAERSKNGNAHLVPLSSLAIEILADVPRIGGVHVFRAHRDVPLKGFHTAKQGLGVESPDWRLHDLRRTFATHLRSIGIDRLVVSKLLNHTEGGVTHIYDRYAADPEKSAAMERWANRLREIISGAPADNVVQLRAK
jgi:integrase